MEANAKTSIADARKRRFTIVDLMILIAALAAALGTSRFIEQRIELSGPMILKK